MRRPSGASTPVDAAAVAAPSPAMKRRRPGDVGAPADLRVSPETLVSVADWCLLEECLAIKPLLMALDVGSLLANRAGNNLPYESAFTASHATERFCEST